MNTIYGYKTKRKTCLLAFRRSTERLCSSLAGAFSSEFASSVLSVIIFHRLTGRIPYLFTGICCGGVTKSSFSLALPVFKFSF